MKKSVLFLGLSVLMSSAAFVSCSKSDVFEANKASIEASEKDEYRSYYEAKYGKIDPNQSWDFTNFSNGAMTRATYSSFVTGSIKDPIQLEKSLHNDKSDVHSKLLTTAATDFNPYVQVALYPAWSCDESKKNEYFDLAVNYNNTSEVINTVKIKNQKWWENNGATTSAQSGFYINTMSMQTASNSDVYWSLNYNGKASRIAKYKVVTVKSGRTYWCFSFDDENDYDDLIYLALPNPAPLAKRYFIEDLGSKDDFDFNDIVVDVMQDAAGKQKAIIRAMGGTLDFTLKIGNTTWTKSGSGFDVETMYNTQSPDFSKTLAEFDVAGWKPNINNISAEVKSNVNGNVILTIPFPKTGEAPMIIAVNTYVDWQDERESLPDNWWTPIE